MSPCQRAERAATIRAHADFQPAFPATENVRPEIQRDREQAVAHGGGGVGERATDLAHTIARPEDGEREIKAAVGRAGPVVQSALVGKACALGVGGEEWKVEVCEQERGAQEAFGFHGWIP